MAAASRALLRSSSCDTLVAVRRSRRAKRLTSAAVAMNINTMSGWLTNVDGDGSSGQLSATSIAVSAQATRAVTFG